MREIKFRAWHEGHYDEKRNRWIHEPEMFYDENPGDCLVYVNQKQNIKEVMQYTGLKDKNGKEIYEGDICYCNTVWTKGVVEYWESVAGFVLTQKFKREESYIDMNRDSGFYNNFIEVIGNIYENPELLSGK